MRIKDYKDFYAGVLFLVFGGLAMWLSTSYNMGTAARMGPGYFPFWLGGTLTALGAIVLIKSLGVHDGKTEKTNTKAMVIFVAMMVLSLGRGWIGLAGPNGALAIGTVAGCVFAYMYGEKSLGLILGSVALFGLFLKGIGLIICVVAIVFISGFASHEYKFKESLISAIHEFKWKETAVVAAVLCLMSWAIFIKGLGLQMPTWVDLPELQRMFQADVKRDAAPADAPAAAPAAETKK